MKNKKIKVLVVETMKKPYVAEIENSMKSLRNMVQSRIQLWFPWWKEPVVVVHAADTKQTGYKPNRAFYDDKGEIYAIFGGTLLFVGFDKNGFRSLDDEQIEKYRTMFQYPEMFGMDESRQLVIYKYRRD